MVGDAIVTSNFSILIGFLLRFMRIQFMGIFVVGPEKLIDSLEMDRSKRGRESFNLFQFITNIHIKLIRQRYAECHSQWQPSMNLCLSEMISKITSHQETSL